MEDFPIADNIPTKVGPVLAFCYLEKKIKKEFSRF